MGTNRQSSYLAIVRVFRAKDSETLAENTKDIRALDCEPRASIRHPMHDRSLELDKKGDLMAGMAPSVLAMREYVYSLIDLEGVRSVLDLGCGKAYDLRRIGEMLGPDARLVGVDALEKQNEVAWAELGGDPRFELGVADVSHGVPFADREFDLVYSRDMLECIPDKDALIREVHRVLRPGGQVVFVHWDWDSQAIDGTDKELVRKMIHTFGDWKQNWMADVDSWMGRRLWRTFSRSGLFEGKVYPYLITETEFCQGNAGHGNINDCSALVRRGMVSQEEFDRFLSNIQALADRDEYFYAVTTYIYVGRSL